jgi:hypothetical protein
MRQFTHLLCVVAATLAFASPVEAQNTFVIKGVFDDTLGQVFWRWVDASGNQHNSGPAEGTASEVDPTHRLKGRLAVPVKKGDKVRFEVEGIAPHGVIFENGKTETAGASPVWSRVSGNNVNDLPSPSAFNHFDRTKAVTTDPVKSGLIIEIEIKSLPEDQPIFFACRVHSLNGSHNMFGAIVLDTAKNTAMVKRIAASVRMVSTGVSAKLSFDEALKNAVTKLPPNPFPDGIRTFSVVEIKGTLGGISGRQVLQVTITAQDEPSHASETEHGETTKDKPTK